ncbi:MAG TPA: lactonase family protein [Pyrinomonadaceae bacterium]|nr:lactonase family protein [Pyrinomonadaceae bacterium]
MADNKSTRRDFVKAAGVATLGAALTSGEARALPTNTARPARELLLYVGTYTSGKSEGIYLYRFDLADGSLTRAGVTGGVSNPSYLTLDRARRFLYTVEETEEFEGEKSGAVSAFKVDPKDGSLGFINRQASKGGAPCYVTADNAGRFVLVANYLGGNVAVLPVSKGGGLGKAVDVEQHSGSGPNRERQEAPHAHSFLLDPSNRHAYACDLGTDKVMIYDFDARRGTLTPNARPSVSLKSGAGPRHLTFDRSGRRVYVLNELDSTVTVFARNPRSGALGELRTYPTLPADFDGENTGADIHLTPDGRFLYCSNRGHDSIAAFRVDARSGSLDVAGHTPTGGKSPRNFAVDPTGRFLLVANQRSDSVVTFRIDSSTGALEATGHAAEIPSPVCLKLTAPFS